MSRSLSRLALSEEAESHLHAALVARVAASQCFASSTRLREFLFYVADCALRDAPEEATEQHIGIHVFQRSPGFNTGEDSIVRTQARALRQRLNEYFTHEGSFEDVIIEIPKGHYLPIFHLRNPVLESHPTSAPPEPESAAHAEPEPISEPNPEQTKRRTRSTTILSISLSLLVLMGLSSWLLRAEKTSPIDRLWGPFFAHNGSLVIYSNAVFTGDSTNGLKYAFPDQGGLQGARSDRYVDTYTGIGELTSVYDLTRLFDQRHATFILKRSLLVTWDEAQASNLIFIGSVAENPSLRMLPPDPDFTMTAQDGAAGFVNHHPLPGEATVYMRPEHPLTKDYAMLALVPGLENGRKMLIFSGLTTLGTEAAVEFASSPGTLDQLLQAVSDAKGVVHPFEALIETTIAGGVPLQARLIAVHKH
jgi:hypothetical protein